MQREPSLEIGGKVLFYPDFALRTAGGNVSVLAPWSSYVLQDRELISGQNPFSDQALLKLLLPALDAKKKSVVERHKNRKETGESFTRTPQNQTKVLGCPISHAFFCEKWGC